MNVVFITMDGARADRIINGYNYKNLISQGVFFSKVIAYAPFTIAAMHAVFSGTYGFKNGVNSYWSSPKFKHKLYKTIPLYMKDAGYVTYGDSINSLILPSDGFDELNIHDELHDNLTERHKSLLDKMAKLKQEGKKFFLYLHYSNIHTGIMQEVLKKYDNFSKEYFSNKQKNSKFYDDLFDHADKYLGSVTNYLKILGLNEDTLLIVMSDHGISVGEKLGERAYGVYCYDTTIISTVLFNFPEVIPITLDQQIRSVDILPTILELLSISSDKNYNEIDGKSLLPLINGKEEERIAFSQSGNPFNTGKPPKEPNVNSVRTNEWKYIKNLHDNSEELYYLKTDPKEEVNLIDIEKDKSHEMRHQMNKILNS